MLLLTVSDEGKGFDEEQAFERQSKGRGLHTMRARLELLGGKLSVDTAPGEGTRVTIGLPADVAQGA